VGGGFVWLSDVSIGDMVLCAGFEMLFGTEKGSDGYG
jgi:hypothetical protein